MWRTLWLLVRRPGFLTQEFNAGKINSYVHPLRLFMFLSVLFFTFVFFFVPDAKSIYGELDDAGLTEMASLADLRDSTVQDPLRTVAHDIAAQRNFEYAFGPVNYSFNRGEAHIVVMDNIIFPNHDDYYLGFRDDQVEWLRQDLESVSKDKMLILCVHIPIRANEGNNVDKVVDLIEQFAEVHVMSGHTHYAENNEYDGHYEHVHGAACGAWWRTVINADGTPNGYSVYRVDGASFSNWYYKSVGFDKDYQIRLYRGNLKYMEGYAKQYEFYYKGEGDIIANIWNADSNWKVEVYEDGICTGEMEAYGSDATKRDAWASGYMLGVLGLSGTSYDKSNVSHLYYYTLKNPSASSVRVVATDQFRNTYEQTAFTPNTTAGFPEALMPADTEGE